MVGVGGVSVVGRIGIEGVGCGCGWEERDAVSSREWEDRDLICSCA